MAQAANEPRLHDAQLQAFIPRSFKSGGVSYRTHGCTWWLVVLMELGPLMVRGYSLQLKQKWLSGDRVKDPDPPTTSTTILHPLTKTEQYQYVSLDDGAPARRRFLWCAPVQQAPCSSNGTDLSCDFNMCLLPRANRQSGIKTTTVFTTVPAGFKQAWTRA